MKFPPESKLFMEHGIQTDVSKVRKINRKEEVELATSHQDVNRRNTMVRQDKRGGSKT
jgi:hypothetical protein